MGSNFFIKSKAILVTIPQAGNVQIGLLKQNLLLREKNLDGFLISKEYHKDKGIHFHIVIVYNKHKFIRSPSKFDYLIKKPTHIEKVKNLQNAIEYCKKDGNFVQYGNVQSDICERLNASDVKNLVYSLICTIKDFNELYVHELPEVREYFLHHIKTLQTAFSYIQNRKRYEDIKHLKGVQQFELNTADIFLQKIMYKLNEMSDQKWNRLHKTENLHIFSKIPNIGKSSLLRKISEYCPSYIYPPINWFQEYVNKIFHCILWDEFSLIGWDIQFLNLFLEGQPIDLPIKYSFNITKTDNPLVIMCSNRSLREHVLKKLSCKCVCFIGENSDILCLGSQKCTVDENASVQYKTLKSRILEVELKENIFGFINTIKPKT